MDLKTDNGRREYHRQWRLKNKDKVAKYRAAYKKKHPEKNFAHVWVLRKLKKGELKRPDKCEACQEECFVQAHHENYAYPMIIDWLCPECHYAADKTRESE